MVEGSADVVEVVRVCLPCDRLSGGSGCGAEPPGVGRRPGRFSFPAPPGPHQRLGSSILLLPRLGLLLQRRQFLLLLLLQEDPLGKRREKPRNSVLASSPLDLVHVLVLLGLFLLLGLVLFLVPVLPMLLLAGGNPWPNAQDHCIRSISSACSRPRRRTSSPAYSTSEGCGWSSSQRPTGARSSAPLPCSFRSS